MLCFLIMKSNLQNIHRSSTMCAIEFTLRFEEKRLNTRLVKHFVLLFRTELNKFYNTGERKFLAYETKTALK